MGTANFMYNHRLDIVNGLAVCQFDVDAYNEDLDTENHLQPDDYERIGEIVSAAADSFVADFKSLAFNPWHTRRIDGFAVETASGVADDGPRYATREVLPIPPLVPITPMEVVMNRTFRKNKIPYLTISQVVNYLSISHNAYYVKFYADYFPSFLDKQLF